MGKKHKQPSLQKVPVITKTPKSEPIIDWHSYRPGWRINKLEMLHPEFGWQVVDGPKLHDIRGKLGQFESRTWHEILTVSKRYNHYIAVSDLETPAKKHLQEIGQDDIEQLMSLRLSAKERIWGILEHNILSILWWDPNHLAYIVEKKHT